MFTDEQIACIFGVTTEQAIANRKKFEQRETNRLTHESYIMNDGRYKCRVCGAAEFQLGDNPCRRKD